MNRSCAKCIRGPEPLKGNPYCSQCGDDLVRFVAVKFDEERIDIIGGNGGDGEHYAHVMSAPPDLVNHPPHYTNHPSGIECIKITEHMGFCLGNAMKHIWRADEKGTTSKT